MWIRVMSKEVVGMNKVGRVYVQGDNGYVQWGRGYFQGLVYIEMVVGMYKRYWVFPRASVCRKW